MKYLLHTAIITPDALAVSSVAAVKHCPILYVMGNGVIGAQTGKYIKSSGAKTVTILGGTLVIDPYCETSIKQHGPTTVNRIAGKSRYDTCNLINKKYVSVLTGSAVCIATGGNYPDALAGSVYAAINKAPVMLVGDSLNSDQHSYLDGKNAAKYYIFGGTGAVSNEIAQELGK